MRPPGQALFSRLHFVACLTVTTLTCALVFSPTGQPWVQPFYLLPILAWAAGSFTWVGAGMAAAILLLAAAIGINPYTNRIADPLVATTILAQALLVSTGFAVVVAWVVASRRRQATAQAAVEAKLREVVATVDMGVFMTRQLDGRIEFWSKGAEKLYGWPAGEAVGQISHTLLQTVHPVPLSEIEAAVVDQGEWSGDLQHTTRTGQILTVRVHKVRRTRVNGEIVVLLEAITDVTAERADQAALKELTHTLERRIEEEVAEREAALTRAKQAQHMQALGQIAAGVAHEFNNMLQAITGALEVIVARPNAATRVAQFGRVALGASERGSVITSRLLAFSGRAPLHAETIEVPLQLDALRDVLAHTLGGLVDISLDLPPLLPRLVVDRAELTTALINLATNARDAMPDGGTVAFAVAVEHVRSTDARHPAGLQPGPYMRFVVQDRGVGMDPATLARAVEPFFTTKDVGKGTGLGLSMVKGFAEQAGGGLTIGSTPGVGTTVTFWLPITETPPPPPPPPPPRAMDSTLRGRVLMVDDEPMVREALAAGLEDSGFTVLVAGSGAEALALLDSGELVDVLVSDYAMAGMDGLALIRLARDRRPALPALILTGYIENLGAGVADIPGAAVLSVLRKPISARQLAAAVAAAMTLARNGHTVA